MNGENENKRTSAVSSSLPDSCQGDLPHDVVQDLLPLYAEDLVSDATRELVEHHLRHCPDCARAAKEFRNSQPEPDSQPDPGNYLKKVRSRFRIVLAAALCFAVAAALILFTSGQAPVEVPLGMLTVQTRSDPQQVHVDIALSSNVVPSDFGIRPREVRQDENSVDVIVEKTDDARYRSISLDFPFSEELTLSVNGLPVWMQGMAIPASLSELWQMAQTAEPSALSVSMALDKLGFTALFLPAEVSLESSGNGMQQADIQLVSCLDLPLQAPLSLSRPQRRRILENTGLSLLAVFPWLDSVVFSIPDAEIFEPLKVTADQLKQQAEEKQLMFPPDSALALSELIGALHLKLPSDSLQTPRFACGVREKNTLRVVNETGRTLHHVEWELLTPSGQKTQWQGSLLTLEPDNAFSVTGIPVPFEKGTEEYILRVFSKEDQLDVQAPAAAWSVELWLQDTVDGFSLKQAE